MWCFCQKSLQKQIITTHTLQTLPLFFKFCLLLMKPSVFLCLYERVGKKTGLFSAAQMLEQDCCDSPPDLDEQRISVRHMSGMSEIFFEHCEFSGIFSILSILKISIFCKQRLRWRLIWSFARFALNNRNSLNKQTAKPFKFSTRFHFRFFRTSIESKSSKSSFSCRWLGGHLVCSKEECIKDLIEWCLRSVSDGFVPDAMTKLVVSVSVPGSGRLCDFDVISADWR